MKRGPWLYAPNPASSTTQSLKVQDLQIDDRSFEQKYYYNGYGYMYRQTLPTGREIFITRDGAGRTLGANFDTDTFATGFKYHPNQQIQEFRYGNGVDFDNYQNNLQQLSRRYIRKSGGDTALDVSYTYDDNGRITDQKYNILAVQNDPNNRTYGYDGVGRLTSAVSTSFDGTGTASFSYDALGNLLTKEIRGRTVTNSYDLSNRLTQSAESAGGPDGEMTRAVAYDDRGNITTLGGLNFIYDLADQPRSVSGTNRTGGTVSGGTYAYDGNLKRVKSVINGVTRYNVYDKEGRLAHVEEGADIATSIQTDYLHAAGMTLARIKDGVFTYMHPDHLGSASAGTNEDGTIAFTEFHTPFGEALLNAAANDNQSDFTGHIRDKDIGMSYMQARYMDPNIGRFLSVDPVGFVETGSPGVFNRYSYCYNDPVNCTDPDGEFGIFGAASGVVLGAVIRGATGGDIFDVKAIAADAALGAVGAGLANKAVQLARLSKTGLSAGQKLGATSNIAKAADEGVYVLREGGETYVGQSGNLASRSAQSAAERGLQNAPGVRLGVEGGKASREVAEQGVLNAAGGVKNTLNAVNPIGAARQGLLQNPQLGNISSVYAQGVSNVGAAGAGATAGIANNLDELQERP